MVHLFLYLLLKANHENNIWQGVEIKRGQLITGRKILSKDTGISEQSIRTCMNRLKLTNELTIKTTNKYTIITICNYDSYQTVNNNNNQQINQQSTNNQPQTRMKRMKRMKRKYIYRIFQNLKNMFWKTILILILFLLKISISHGSLMTGKMGIIKKYKIGNQKYSIQCLI